MDTSWRIWSMTSKETFSRDAAHIIVRTVPDFSTVKHMKFICYLFEPRYKVLTYMRGWTGGYPIPSSLPLSPTSLPLSPPLPSPCPPTSLPLLPHFPPPIRFFPPPDKKIVFIQELKRIYVSEELRMVQHRLSCRIFMHNYPVGKEPYYLLINVFSRTSKGNIIYTRQNKKTSCLWPLLAPTQF